MFRLARKQGALGGYVHPYSKDPPTVGYAVARGFPVDLAHGAFEYLEVMTSARLARFTSKVWHRALNCGFRVTASGGEDSISGLHRTRACRRCPRLRLFGRQAGVGSLGGGDP